MSSLRSHEEPVLDQKHYDDILIGTGLTHTILASSLSKCGRSVLHLDLASEYGSHLSTLSLEAFRDFLLAHSHSAEASEQPTATPTPEEIARWKEQTKDEEGRLEFRRLERRRPFFEAKWTDFVLKQAEKEQRAKEEEEEKQQQQEEEKGEENDSATAESNDVAPSAPASTSASSSPASVSSPLLSESRRYSVDVSPHMLFARSPLIDLLVRSGIHHYLEFKAVDSAYFVTNTTNKGAAAPTEDSSPPSLTLLPLSKAAIFQSTTLSMLEKRQLMKFLHLALGDVYHQPFDEQAKQTTLYAPTTSATTSAAAAGGTLTEEQLRQPFVEFLKTQKLSPNLVQMLLYAVALLDHSAEDASTRSLSTSGGLYRLRAYLSSIGRFSAGAFLYPNYGISELPQAFARLAAVNRAVYILRFKPVAAVFEKVGVEDQEKKEGAAETASSSSNASTRRYKGILTEGGQFLTSDSLITEAEYGLVADASTPAPTPAASSSSSTDETAAADAAAASHSHFITRFLLVLDGPLSSSVAGTPLSSSSFFSLPPPSSSPSSSPLYGLQVGWEVGVAPRGKVLVHLFAAAQSLQQARENAERMERLALAWTQPLEEADEVTAASGKPHLLAFASYKQRCYSTASSAPSSSLFSTPSPSSSISLSLDSCLSLARSLFSTLLPSQDFHDVLSLPPPGASAGSGSGGDGQRDEEMDLLEQLQPTEDTQKEEQEEQEAEQETEQAEQTEQQTEANTETASPPEVASLPASESAEAGETAPSSSSSS